MNEKKQDPISLLYDKLSDEQLVAVRRHRRGPARFRASEVANCSRQIWYRRSGYLPQPRTAFLQLVSEAGNIVHDYVRALLFHFDLPLSNVKEIDGKIIESETKVRTFEYNNVEFTIAGRDDGFITHGGTTDGDDDRLAVLELKSMGFWYHKYLTKAFVEGYTDIRGNEHAAGNDAVVARMKDKHRNYIAQGTVTAIINDMKYVYVMVVCRDNMAVGLYDPDTGVRHGGAEWEVTDEMRDKIFAKLARIETAIRKNKPPMPEYASSSKECSYCDYKYLCHDAVERKLAGKTPTVVYPVPGILETTEE